MRDDRAILDGPGILVLVGHFPAIERLAVKNGLETLSRS
jgi:hypothetical protein